MKNNNNKKNLFKFTFIFTLTVFLIMSFALLTAAIGVRILFLSPLFGQRHVPQHTFAVTFILLSILLGTILSGVFSRIIIKPLDKLLEALDSIIRGDYSVRVEPKGIKRSKRLGRRFNHMAEELESIETLNNDFIGNFSHEFKTPITSILGFARLLNDSNLSDAQKNNYIDIIISESERLSTLSKNALLFSKVENWNYAGETEQFNLSEQIRNAVVLLENKWSEKQIVPSFEGSEIIVEANKELLGHIWINLLDNAIKFSPENSTIDIFAQEKDNYAVLTFCDNGIGMDEETQKHAFDKFFQSDRSHSTQGNGLGLPLVKKITELHHGTVSVESTPGQGTEITVNIPKTYE